MPGTFGLSPKPCGAGGLADIKGLASRKWKFSSPWGKKVGVAQYPVESDLKTLRSHSKGPKFILRNVDLLQYRSKITNEGFF
jgi:hypothetical protein